MKVTLNGEFLVVEVISAKVGGNGAISTAVEVDQLQSHHSRTRRSTEKDRKVKFIPSFDPVAITHKVIIATMYFVFSTKLYR